MLSLGFYGVLRIQTRVIHGWFAGYSWVIRRWFMGYSAYVKPPPAEKLAPKSPEFYLHLLYYILYIIYFSTTFFGKIINRKIAVHLSDFSLFICIYQFFIVLLQRKKLKGNKLWDLLLFQTLVTYHAVQEWIHHTLRWVSQNWRTRVFPLKNQNNGFLKWSVTFIIRKHDCSYW